MKAVEEGLPFFLGRVRLGPLDSDKERDEHSPTEHHPTQVEYWAARGGDWGLGHAAKYPYGFYGLYGRAANDEIKKKALEASFRIL